MSGTVSVIGTVSSISVSSIVFKQGDTTVHVITTNLPAIVNNTWTLANNSAWTSKLTQGDYTVIVNLAGKGASNQDVTGLNSITTKIDITQPAQPTFTLTNDTGVLNSDGVTNNGMMTVAGLESDATWQYSTNGGTNWTNGTGTSFTLAEGTHAIDAIQVKQTNVVGNVSSVVKNAGAIVVDTLDPLFAGASTANVAMNTDITTTVYDAQASNLSGGNADDGITYSIKNASTSKFAITTDTGIVTYKAIQTTVHTDAVTIIATDVAGNATEQTVTVSVRIADIAQGFVMNGENVEDHSGKSVSSAGDVNGDGLDDLIVGAYHAESYAGKSYVVFGKTDGSAVNLSAIALGTGGFVINGENADDWSGNSVSSAGDVNGDGLDDLIVGAFQADLANKSKAGKSYVIFGKTDETSVDLSKIASGTGGFVINGENIDDWSGHPVSSAGDVNGDGLDDLIVGAYLADPSGTNDAGKSYVVFGKKDKAAVDLSVIALGTGGFVINGENADDWSGYSVSSAGDVNGDGLDDLIVGAFQADPANKSKAGKSYVIFGKTDETSVDLSKIASGTGGFVINGENIDDWSGHSVSSAGDVNGDGLDDLIVGAYLADPSGTNDAGESYVVFGKKDKAAVDLSVIALGTGGFVINGENAGDYSGVSVSSAGDVNGDGLDDLIVGAHQADPDNKSNAGKPYVVFGKTNGSAVDLSAIASGTGGFVINGENIDDGSGISVSSAGDVNGDGLDDLIVGAYQANPNSKDDAGKSYVVFGKTGTKAVDLADISASNGVVAHAIDFQGNGENNILTGTSADELFVAGLGDDTLIGNGGTDVFNAGAGNDIIVINAGNLAKLSSKVLSNHLLARVDGGGNTDTLKLAGADLNLDLTQIDNGRIQDIEIIDLTGSGNNTLTLNLNDLLDISSSTNVLKVVGNSGDKVEVKTLGFEKSNATEVVNGITYDIYSHASTSTAKLWLAQNLTVSLPSIAQGFVMNGESADDKSGYSVSSAGDVNGDGLDDLIVGAYQADPNSKSNAGKSYVVFGKTDGSAVNLSAIALGTGGFVINGENADDWSGYSVSSAGDVNGDGLDDLIVGARLADPDNKDKAGKSYVVFGKTDKDAVDLSAIASGTGGFVINGENADDRSGLSVSSAGDVNGDGLDDLIVGAYFADPDNKDKAGKSYVIFGKKDKTAVNLSAIAASSGMGGFVINGENVDDRSGVSVSSAGDVNGDGLDDLIVGALMADPDNKDKAGKSYVVFGKTNGSAVDLSVIASGAGGFVINGENADDWSGLSVSSAGDVNGDGLDDLIVGAFNADPNNKSDAGKSYVVFGKKEKDAVNLSVIAAGTGGFVIKGESAYDDSGISVSSAGDVNGDGLDDLIVGAHLADPDNKSNAGKSYVVFGKTNGSAVDLSVIAAGTGGFVINGESASDNNGVSVSSAGDVNGDGLDDLIVGASWATPSSKESAGKSYVVFGKTDTEAVDLADISVGNGVAAHAIDFQGNGENNILTGTSADELFVAGLGNDVLTGNGGADVFNAGKGDDIIIINADNLAKLSSKVLSSDLLARVDGGGNTDTLKLAGADLNLDLTQIDNGRIQDIEIIDLTGSGNNTLKLNLNDLLDISSSTNVLKVIGDAGDKVDIELSDNAFVKDSTKIEDGITYDIYNNANAADTVELWVEQDLAVF
ncbi:Flagellar hook-length control protein FliK [Bathymodiolus thermophilus thioautotrophic gill symbiont]|nr:Flagellar hook-length control protein FliK [Bathymodiolus thermophilus thioautotrophic gill symbiont]